jgi:DNA ligase (NAD+)
MITLDSLDLQNTSPQKIGEILIEAKKAYYTGGKPIMDDATYDTLEEILRKKLPYHRIFTKTGTTHFNSGFDKKNHQMPMGSLNKVNKIDDLVHYFELKKITKNQNFVIQPKCDGISLEIIYHNGNLVHAITRGDGQIGDVITQNVAKMKNVILNLNNNFTGSVRCEIVMLNDDFNILNQLIKKDTLQTNEEVSEGFYSNSRNAVSGISQRLDGKYCEYCSLYAVDLYSSEVLSNIPTEIDKINFLKNNGLISVENLLCQDFDQVEEIYQKFLNYNRKNYPFEIDGLVIKINDLKLQHQLGTKNNRPQGQVAYKFPSRSSQTRIINVDWQVGPMGTITPVAQVDPIEISGAIITFASLANYDLIKEKNINIDDIVEVQRRGDVIPHVEKVVSKVTPGYLLSPTNCPSCGSKLIEDKKYLKCPNIKNCPAQILGSLKLFCDILEIKGISDKTIAKLWQLNLIRLPGDFYNLKVSDFENIFGLGTKSGTNVVNAIQAKKTLTLKQVLNASIIPNFSSKRILQLINSGYNTQDKIINITISQLEALPGIQTTLAHKIYQGIQDRKNFIESILSQVILKTENSKNENLAIKGFIFAITGTLSIPRKELEDKIISLGGKITSSVTSNTDYLITNESKSNSGKFISAQKYGTKIINEEQFNQLAVKR